MTRSGHYFEFASRDALLQLESLLMGQVFRSGQDDRWTGDRSVMVFAIFLAQRLELADYCLQVRHLVALGKEIGKLVCQRCRPNAGLMSGNA